MYINDFLLLKALLAQTMIWRWGLGSSMVDEQGSQGVLLGSKKF